jgi:hypothetical protein
LNQLIGSSVRGDWELAARIAATMSDSDLAVQKILPRAGTAWQDSKREEDRKNDSDGDDAPADKPVPKPPTPGTGKIVDRIV